VNLLLQFLYFKLIYVFNLIIKRFENNTNIFRACYSTSPTEKSGSSVSIFRSGFLVYFVARERNLVPRHHTAKNNKNSIKVKVKKRYKTDDVASPGTIVDLGTGSSRRSRLVLCVPKIVTLCQFHQRYMLALFVQTSFWWLFLHTCN